MLSITSAKLSGNPDASGWVQIHDFTPSEVSDKGNLHIIISVESASDVESLSIGRDIASAIYQKYYHDEKPAFSALQNAVTDVVGRFGQKFEKLEIAAASFSGTTLSSVVAGGGIAILY